MATKSTQTRPPRYAVVVGFDFTAASEVALKEALELTRHRPGGEVHVVYALDEEVTARVSKGVAVLDVLLERAKTRLRARLAKAWDSLQESGNPTVLAMHVRVRAPHHAVVQVAIDLNADLIVVGAHSTGLKGLLTGKTGAKIIKAAPCPVMVAKAKSYKGLEASAHVEPQCPACLKKRLETSGEVWWCQRHRDRIALPLHVYSYSREHPFQTRDADVEGPAR